MIKFALMGCGKIAKRHAFLLGNSLINGAKLVAVCDLDLNRAKELINEFENINAYDDLDKMMTSEDVDVLVILTPSGMHARHTIEASKYKAHIVVEKPMALTLKDADQMINVCKNNDISSPNLPFKLKMFSVLLFFKTSLLSYTSKCNF